MSRRRSASYEVARRLLRTVNPGNARLDLSSLRSGRDNEVHWSSLTAPARLRGRVHCQFLDDRTRSDDDSFDVRLHFTRVGDLD